MWAREQQQAKYWGYITAIMAVYLAVAERKLGFQPACLHLNLMHTHAASQVKALYTAENGSVCMNEWQTACAAGLGSMCTFLGCMREE